MTDAAVHHHASGASGGSGDPHVVAESGVEWSGTEGHIPHIWVYVACTLTFCLLAPMIYGVYRFLMVNSHRYAITSQRLIETSGVFTRDTEELELYRVKDISIVQPPVQRLFGRGTVQLLTSDRSTPRVRLIAIPNARAVANLLRSRVEQCRVQKGVREID